MTGVDEMLTWYRAQLDEDERVAQWALRQRQEDGSDWWWNNPDESSGAENLIARWDPARVLAEVEAKRRILDEHPRMPEDWGTDYAGDCRTCSDPHPCKTVRLLALPHAGRPGYLREWAV